MQINLSKHLEILTLEDFRDEVKSKFVALAPLTITDERIADFCGYRIEVSGPYIRTFNFGKEQDGIIDTSYGMGEGVLANSADVIHYSGRRRANDFLKWIVCDSMLRRLQPGDEQAGIWTPHIDLEIDLLVNDVLEEEDAREIKTNIPKAVNKFLQENLTKDVVALIHKIEQYVKRFESIPSPIAYKRHNFAALYNVLNPNWEIASDVLATDSAMFTKWLEYAVKAEIERIEEQQGSEGHTHPLRRPRDMQRVVRDGLGLDRSSWRNYAGQDYTELELLPLKIRETMKLLLAKNGITFSGDPALGSFKFTVLKRFLRDMVDNGKFFIESNPEMVALYLRSAAKTTQVASLQQLKDVSDYLRYQGGDNPQMENTWAEQIEKVLQRNVGKFKDKERNATHERIDSERTVTCWSEPLQPYRDGRFILVPLRNSSQLRAGDCHERFESLLQKRERVINVYSECFVRVGSIRLTRRPTGDWHASTLYSLGRSKTPASFFGLAGRAIEMKIALEKLLTEAGVETQAVWSTKSPELYCGRCGKPRSDGCNCDSLVVKWARDNRKPLLNQIT